MIKKEIILDFKSNANDIRTNPRLKERRKSSKLFYKCYNG